MGQDDEVRFAEPDVLFNIVYREDPNGYITAAAFLIPNIIPEIFEDYWEFVTSIEELTGLDFLVAVPDHKENAIERSIGELEDWM